MGTIFTDEPMVDIIARLEEILAVMPAGGIVDFEVVDPDRLPKTYAGTAVTIGGVRYLHRGYKAWTDLAELLGCRMMTPKRVCDGRVKLRIMKLDTQVSFHGLAIEDKREKYGVGSMFSAIRKNEEPAFVHAFVHALGRVGITHRRRILDLGVNSGDEFDLIRSVAGDAFPSMQLVGIDHSASAIAKASARFPEPNARFDVQDINALDALELGTFDLIMSIGTLQSPGIEFKPLLAKLVQHYLKPDGAILLGFPNARWMDGELIYGAKAPNYAFSEQSLLFKDVHYCKKYLQQKCFRVTLSGKYYLFLSATRIK